MILYSFYSIFVRSKLNNAIFQSIHVHKWTICRFCLIKIFPSEIEKATWDQFCFNQLLFHKFIIQHFPGWCFVKIELSLVWLIE